ncbi:MAG: glycerol-3-phosphate 1-O-acyltransferase PlsY [Bacillota bacterium]
MVFIVLVVAYLIGSLPFGYIASRMLQRTDIRNYGSGNIGATNVLRVMGWRAALPVFILDMLKGAAAVLLAKAISSETIIYLSAGFLAMIGHSLPLFLKFKGGKAVATGIGVLAAVSGWVTLSLIITAGIIVALTRYVSLGSIIGAILVPLFFWLFDYDLPYIFFGLAMAVLVAARHHENIGRLLKGTESKLGQKL